MNKINIVLLFLACVILSVTAVADTITLTTVAPAGLWQKWNTTNDIYYNDGNVGIGTGTTNPPAVKLHVVGNTLIEGQLQLNGPIATAIKTASVLSGGTYTITDTDSTVLLQVSCTVRLPDATQCSGRQYVLKKIFGMAVPGGGGDVSIWRKAGTLQLIDGASSYILKSPNQSVTVQSNGSNWVVIADANVSAPIIVL